MCKKDRKKEKKEKTITETFESEGYIEVKPLPKEVEVFPSLADFKCDALGTPAELAVTIKNNSETKYVAFKVVSSDNTIFKLDPQSGTVPPGSDKAATIHYANKEPLKRKHLFLVYFTLVETDSLPKEYQSENNCPPHNYDGTHFMPAVFRTGLKLFPPPKEIVIRPDKVPIKCGPLGGKPANGVFVIINRSERLVAYKVLRSAPDQLKVHGRAGVIKPHSHKAVICKYMNERELTSDFVGMIVFIQFVDTDKVPDEFDNRRLAPPTTFDGCRPISVDITYDAPSAEVVPSAEISQTGAQTTTEADVPAIPAPPPPAAAAAPGVAAPDAAAAAAAMMAVPTLPPMAPAVGSPSFEAVGSPSAKEA